MLCNAQTRTKYTLLLIEEVTLCTMLHGCANMSTSCHKMLPHPLQQCVLPYLVTKCVPWLRMRARRFCLPVYITWIIPTIGRFPAPWTKKVRVRGNSEECFLFKQLFVCLLIYAYSVVITELWEEGINKVMKWWQNNCCTCKLGPWHFTCPSVVQNGMEPVTGLIIVY